MKHYISLDISQSWSGRDLWGPETFDFPSWWRHSSLILVSSSVLVYTFLLSSPSCSPQLCQVSNLWFGRVNQIMNSLHTKAEEKKIHTFHTQRCIYRVGASRRFRQCSLVPPEMLMEQFLLGTVLLQTKIWLLLRCYSCSYPSQTLLPRLPSARITNCVA